MSIDAGGPAPHFTALVANHDHADLVVEAVDSVLSQHYPAERRDVVVVDDGSTDDSLQRLAAFAGRPDVTVLAQPNRGHCAALAAAAAAARGDWLCLLDADDRFRPDKLARLAECIARHELQPDGGFICHDACIVDAATGAVQTQTWFDIAGLHPLVPLLNLSGVKHFFPFSITSAQVYGRELLTRLLRGVPLWDLTEGPDAAFGHLAMLHVGQVLLTPERLSDYRVHGDNNFASMRGGRFQDKPVWHGRWPALLRLLERTVDALPLADAERAERMAYVGRVEHAVRAVPAGRSPAQPWLSFIIDVAGRDERARQATRQAVQGQTHERCECIEVDEEHGDVVGARLRSALPAARGSYLCILRAGDRPDPRFAERHLQTHRFAGFNMVTACDLRLVDADGAVQALGVMGQAAGWGQRAAQQPAFGAGLGDWPLAPAPALVWRRTPFIDAFFETASPAWPARLWPWLLGQWAVMLGGATRLLENLIDLCIDEGSVANPFWFAGPCDHAGPIPLPDSAWAAEALLGLYLATTPQAQASYPESWERRFLATLLHAAGPAGAARLQHRLRTAPTTDTVLRLQQLLAGARTS